MQRLQIPSKTCCDHGAPVTSCMGFPAVFKRPGFMTVAHPSKSKCIMRISLQSRPPRTRMGPVLPSGIFPLTTLYLLSI